MLTWSTHLLTEYVAAVNAAEDESVAIAVFRAPLLPALLVLAPFSVLVRRWSRS